MMLPTMTMVKKQQRQQQRQKKQQNQQQWHSDRQQPQRLQATL
jgi:hypothetical protein